MDSEQRDFKAVKVQLKGQKTNETLSRSMLYSGINIFGQLSQLYLQNKEAGGSYSSFQSQIKPSGASNGESSEGSMMHLSQEVLAIFKRMQKKDSTTKIKAFAELERYLENMDQAQFSQQEQDSDELQSLLTFFLYHFCRIIMNEPDKKVREAAHSSFAQFIKRARRRLGPHLKKVFALWFCSFYDVSQEVAAIAKKNFELAFPENKRDQVFKLAFKNFLNFANEQLKQSEDQISDSAADLSKAQREDVFDRITSSVLYALANSFNFTKTWNQEEQEHFQRKLIDVLDLNVKIESEESKDKKAKTKQVQSYLFGFLQSNYRGRVRASCLQFISNLLVNLPQDIVSFHIGQLSPLVFKLVGDDNSSLQNTFWREAIFTLGKNYPQSWETINIKKDFLPRLYSNLKNACFGSSIALYENFIKFSSIFPFYQLVDYQEDKTNKASLKERCNLIREAFTTMYQGLKNDEAVAFHADLTKGYYDTLCFILLKRVQPLLQSDKASKEDKEYALEQIKKTIQVPIEDYISSYEKFQSRVQNQRNIRHTLPSRYSRFLTDLAERNCLEEIVASVIQNTWDSIVISSEKPNTVRYVAELAKNESSLYNSHILKSILVKYVNHLVTVTQEKVQDLNKENIEITLKFAQNLQRILYKFAKSNRQAPNDAFYVQQLSSTLDNIAFKEDLAKNVLSSDVLTKFQKIKSLLLDSIVLSLISSESSQVVEILEKILNDERLDIKLRSNILLPERTFKKVKTQKYFEALSVDKLNEVIQNFIENKILINSLVLKENYLLIESGIQRSISNEPSFINQQSFSRIIEQVTQNIMNNQRDILQNFVNFRAVHPILKSQQTDQVIELKRILFQRLLNFNINHSDYKQLWSLYSEILTNSFAKKDDFFLDYCKATLKASLKQIINRNSNLQLQNFDKLTFIIRQFVEIFPNKQDQVQDLFLQEENFQNLQNNSLPLKMLKDILLSGGIAFDVSKIIKEGNRYIWLISELLNIRHLPSISQFIQLKKQLLIFVDTEVMPSLISNPNENKQDLLIQICQYLHEKGSARNDFVFTVDDLIKKLVDPGEDYPADEKPVLSVDQFKQIFFSSQKDIIQKFTDQTIAAYGKETSEFFNIVQHLTQYVCDEKQVQDLYQNTSTVLRTIAGTRQIVFNEKYGLNLELLMLLTDYFSISQEPEDWTLNLLISTISQIEKSQVDNFNIISSVLSYVGTIINKLGVTKFNHLLIKESIDFQSFLSFCFEKKDENASSSVITKFYLNLFQIVRKTIGSNLIIDKQTMINQVIEVAKDQALNFERKMEVLQQRIKQFANDDTENFNKDVVDEQDDSRIEHFEFEMMQELSETLLVFPSYINSQLKEDNLYILISSGIESLQKAGFVLLKSLYENFIPQIKYQFDEDEVLKQLKQETEDRELEIEKNNAEEDEKEEEEQKKEDNKKKEKYRNKLAFKNISAKLIDLIDNPPFVNYDEEQSNIITDQNELDSLIFGDNKEGCMSNKTFGYMLAWNALLCKIESGRIKNQFQKNNEYQTVLGAINEYLEENYEIYHMILIGLVAYLPVFKKGLQEVFNVSQFDPIYIQLSEQKQNTLFSVYTLINFMKVFPSLGRKFYQDCPKQILDIVLPYLKQIVSPAILENEIKKIEVAQSQIRQSELEFSLFKSTKEIHSTYRKGEIEISLKIKIPNDYPIKMVDVEFGKTLKLTETQKRKWMLQIRKILQYQNGDVISAVLQWKSNIEKEADGLEDCYICYCVVHEGDQSLPKMPCKTCKNKFHAACIRKWFSTSGKSNCPICQNYFF